MFQQKRPAWPESTPPEFKSLAEVCWQPNPSARPSFDTILDQLMRMRATIKEKSKPLDAILARSPRSLEEDESRPPLLSVAEHASINFSMSDWVPHIMEEVTANFTPPSCPSSRLSSVLGNVPHQPLVPAITPPTSSNHRPRPKAQSSPSIEPSSINNALPTSVLQLNDLQAAAANGLRGKKSGRLDSRETFSTLGRLDEETEGPSISGHLPPSPISRKVSGDLNPRRTPSRDFSQSSLNSHIALLQAEASLILGRSRGQSESSMKGLAINSQVISLQAETSLTLGRGRGQSESSMTGFPRLGSPRSSPCAGSPAGAGAGAGSHFAGSHFAGSHFAGSPAGAAIRNQSYQPSVLSGVYTPSVSTRASEPIPEDVFHSVPASPRSGLHSLVSTQNDLEQPAGPSRRPPSTHASSSPPPRLGGPTDEEAKTEKKKKSSLAARFLNAFK